MNSLKKKLKFDADQIQLYLILLPCLIWYLVFMFKPMYGILIAFKDYSIFKGVWGSDWVGLANFKEFLTSPEFFKVLKNTLIINFYSLLFEFPFAIIFALMLNEVKNKIFKAIAQTASFLPYFIAIVTAVGIAVNMLAPTTGVVNILIEKLGFEKIYFLIKPEWFRSIFISLNMWKGTGFNAIIYLAALSGVDEQLYEAAKIDGANKFAQLWHITLPSILPTIVVMLILRIGSMLNVAFETVLLLYQPATYSTADVISTYVYRLGILQNNYGLATSVGLFNSFVALLLVYSANYLSKKFTQLSIW